MILLKTLTMISFFILMEAIAWFTHKYVMHGLLWPLHKSHHEQKNTWFELNDVFTLFFSSIAIILIYQGFEGDDLRLYAGLGITLYGIAYFLFHDIYVHQRIRAFRNIRISYFEILRRAHKIHHKNLSKENGEAFGFLYISPAIKQKLINKQRK